MNPLPSSVRVSRLADRLLLASLVALSGLLLVVLMHFGFGRDQSTFSLVGDAILRGGAPYADAWDIKPPLIYVLYAAAKGLTGSDRIGIRALEALGFASLFLAYAVLSRRHLGDARAGAVGAALAILTHVQLEFWNTGQAEGFGAIATVWALVCATFRPASAGRSGRQRQLAAWSGVGALYAVAGLLKPPLGLGLLVSGAFALRWNRSEPRDEGRPSAGAALSAITAGASGVVAATAIFLTLRGAWPGLVEALFSFVPAYAAVGFEASRIPGQALSALADLTWGYSWILPAGLLLMAGLPRLAPGERSAATHVLLVVGVQWLGIAAQAKFFPYHFAASLPLLALVAGWGLWKLWVRVHGRVLPVLALLAVLVFLSGQHPIRPTRAGMGFWQRSWTRLRTPADGQRAVRERLESPTVVSLEGTHRVADWLAENTGPEDTVFVWGFEPLVYHLSARRPASRYVHNIPQRLDWPGRDDARRTLLDELDRERPSAFVVVRRDRFPRLAGNRLDSTKALAAFPQLDGWLRRHYQPVRTFDNFTIFALSGQSTPPSVVVILVDQLRADSFEAFATRTVALAERGVVFEQMRSAAPWTYPSVLSMMSGLHPQQHGADGHRFENRLTRFSEDVPLLQSLLREAGFRTAAFITNPFLREWNPFHVGFDEFRAEFVENLGNVRPAFDEFARPDMMYSPSVNREIRKHYDAAPLEAPEFTYVHYIDVHGPWTSAPFESSYEAAIRFVDERIVELYDYFHARYDGRLYFFVTSDHGRALQGDTRVGYGREWRRSKHTVHDFNLRIPFVLLPSSVVSGGRRIDRACSNVDFAPTVLDLVGIRVSLPFAGVSLAPWIWAEPVDPAADRVTYARHSAFGFHSDTIVSGGRKYLRFFDPETGGEIARRSFDLEADPRETASLGAEFGQADAWLRREAGPGETAFRATLDPISAETRDQLRALGYLGGDADE